MPNESSLHLLPNPSSSHSVWLKNPLAILADSAEGGLVVKGQKVIELVAKGQQPKSSYDEVMECGELVILPGLINGHHHFYQTLTRALPQALNKPLFGWLTSLYPVWAGLEPDMLYQATRLALAELLLSGCTTAADHHYLFPEALTQAMDIQAEAAASIGIRMTMTRGSMSLGVNDGGLPPQSTVQQEDTILADSERVIKRYHDPREGSMLQVALAPCSPFSVTPELMRNSATLAAQHNVMLHTHLAETIDEENFCLQRFGLRTVDYLDSVGWLGPQTWLAHGIHFNDDEIKRLGAAGTGICHCPTSNMMLASGMAPVQELEAAGMSGLVSESPDIETVNQPVLDKSGNATVDEDGNPITEQQTRKTGTTTKAVNYSVMNMKAMVALQEAMARIETLEAKVTALENK